MNNNNLSHLSSNLNSSEEAYLNLMNSYITATREILNGYTTFESGITRVINSQIFRNFIRPSLSSTQPNETTATINATTSATRETDVNTELNLETETPLEFVRRDIQIPNAPSRLPSRFRFNPPSNSSPPLSPFQIPTPVRLTSRLDTSVTSVSQTNQSTQNTNASTPNPTPPFASSFVRYRLPVPIGPPRRVSTTNANDENININTSSNIRGSLEVPIFSPPNSMPHSPQRSLSPPPPPVNSVFQTWQELRRQRQEQRQEQRYLNSLSPIRPVEPTPLPPAPLTSATQMMLNLLDTPRLNESLIYYTQIIDRELLRSNGMQRSLSYDIIQQQTKIVPYCTINNPINDICPISQVPFDIIDSVMQINICSHNFNPYSLLRWFDSNSTCPMCRREINIENEDNNNEDDDEQTIHMYNARSEEEPYRSGVSNRNRENRYDDSDFSSVG